MSFFSPSNFMKYHHILLIHNLNMEESHDTNISEAP